MTSWTDKFSSLAIPGAFNSLAQYSFATNLVLDWPAAATGTVAAIANIVELTPTVAALSVTLPAANAASAAAGALFVNKGTYSVAVLNAAGGGVATLAPGDSKSIYIADNSSIAGVWSIVAVGSATSVADASTLAGPGLKVVGATLGIKSTVVEVAGNYTVTTADRGKTIVLTSGSGTFTFPDVTTLGGDFFVHLKNAGIGTLTVDPFSAQTIDGAATKVLAPDDSCTIYTGATALYSVGFGQHATFAFTQLVKDVTAGGTYTLTAAEAANKLINLTASSGFPTVATVIVLPAVASVYYVYVGYNGSASSTFKTAAAGGIALPAGSRSILYCDGTNVVLAQSVAVGTSIGIQDGSVTVPSIYFSSEAGTGIYRPTSSAWAVAVQGVERLRVTTTGVAVTGTVATSALAATGAVTAASVAATGAVTAATVATSGIVASGGVIAGVLAGLQNVQVSPSVGLGFPGIPASGTSIGGLAGFGYTVGTTWFAGGAVNVIATETWASTAAGSRVMIRTTLNGSVALRESFSFDHDGGVTLPVLGSRIRGDLSNATLSSRLVFQSSTVNGNSSVGATPNGTASTAEFRTYNSSDLANTSFGVFYCSSSTAGIFSGAVGTGVIKPITVGVGAFFPTTYNTDGTRTYTGNSIYAGTGVRLTADFTNATFSSRLAFQTSTANGNTSIGALPNGSANASSFQAYGTADPTNSSRAYIGTTASSQSYVISDKTGTGTVLPLVMGVGSFIPVKYLTTGISMFGSPGGYSIGVAYTDARRDAAQSCYIGGSDSTTPALEFFNAGGGKTGSISNAGTLTMLGDVVAFGTP